jgi:riboflavin kinase
VAQNKTFLGNYGERWFDFADVLVPLVEFGGLHGYVRLSGSSLGSLLGISQQAAARRLIKAAEAGFIDKRQSVFGFEYMLSEKAKSQLSGFLNTFSKRPEPKRIDAKVFSGVGEGRFFLELRGYRKQFEQIYDFKPYPGTLNLRAKQSVLDLFKPFPTKIVNGFRTGGRTYGLVLSYKARLHYNGQNQECVAVFPQISRYGDETVEVIAPNSLRKKLGLADGDIVELEPILDYPRPRPTPF